MYGYFRHSTINIGDDMQSLAARLFLPPGARTFDRDDSHAEERRGECFVIANGWLMHPVRGRYHIPFHEDVVPFFISVHICPEFRRAFPPAAVEYLKRHEPIGCRDRSTLEFLKSRGIDAYWTGCLTMVLGEMFSDPQPERQGIVLVEPHGAVPPEIGDSAITREHHISNEVRRSLSARFAHAERLLRLYRSARLVVTSRLHCALPAIAGGTPVVIVHHNPGDPRFGALEGLARVYSPTETIDWNPAPIDIRAKAAPLYNLVARAVRERRNPMADGMRYPDDFQ